MTATHRVADIVRGPTRPSGEGDGHERARKLITGVVLATVAAGEGGPAAALHCGDEPLVRRLVAQLAGLGLARAVVITRPGWEPALEGALNGLGVEVAIRASPGLHDDLRTVAAIARSGDALLIADGEVFTHRTALAGLLDDPRLLTAILERAGAPDGMPWRHTRSAGAGVMSAGSAYHSVTKPNGAFLGLLKVDGADRSKLVGVAERLAKLTEGGLPGAWEEELQRRAQRCPVADQHSDRPPPAFEAEAVARASAITQDVVALLLVGLVRVGAHVQSSFVRELFWARPLSSGEAQAAARDIATYDEDRLALDSAVKATDGFFTTFFVSPYSKYIARWAARRGWTPNAVTTASMAIGIAAAAAFATGERIGLVAGAVLLQAAFAADCVDGQLARYTRRFSSSGAWLDSIFDRAKEYTVFAGLAIGATRGFGYDAWGLAAAALTLQTIRHMIAFSLSADAGEDRARFPNAPLEQPHDGAGGRAEQAPASRAPSARRSPATSPLGRLAARAARRTLSFSRSLNRREAALWVKRIIVFPIGERFAVISITAAVATPRTTFVVLLAWGAVAAAYSIAGHLARSMLV